MFTILLLPFTIIGFIKCIDMWAKHSSNNQLKLFDWYLVKYHIMMCLSRLKMIIKRR